MNDHGVALAPGLARPSWLRSKSAEKWGAAMAVCQSAAATCGYDGRCAQNNFCFSIFRHRHDALMRLRAEIDRRIGKLLRSIDGEEELP